MVLMPTIDSFHLEKIRLVQNEQGTGSIIDSNDNQIVLEFSEDLIVYRKQNREFSFDELHILVKKIPAGSTVLLAGDADCSYRKSLLLKSALSRAGFTVQELSLVKEK